MDQLNDQKCLFSIESDEKLVIIDNYYSLVLVSAILFGNFHAIVHV